MLSRLAPACLVSTLCAIALLYNLSGGSLPNSDDPIYATIAKEQLSAAFPASGGADASALGAGFPSLLHTTFYGAEIFEKPPLFFWMLDVSYIVFGTTDFAARLPDALCALLLLVLVYFASSGSSASGRSSGSGSLSGSGRSSASGSSSASGPSIAAGAAAALFLLSSSEFYFNARRVMTDMPFLLATFGFFVALSGSGSLLRTASCHGVEPRQASRVRLLAAGVMMALAVMTKGVAFGVPFLAAVVFVLSTRGWRGWRVSSWIALLLPPLLLAGAWHGYQVWQQGTEFLSSYFGYHAVERMSAPLVGETDAFFYLRFLFEIEGSAFAVVVLAGLVLALFSAIRSRGGLDLLLGIFAAAYAATITAMGTRLPHYILPLLIVSAIYLGRAVGWAWAALSNQWARLALGLATAVCLAASFGAHNSFHMLSGDYSPDLKRLGQLAASDRGPDRGKDLGPGHGSSRTSGHGKDVLRWSPVSPPPSGGSTPSLSRGEEGVAGLVSPPRLVTFNAYNVASAWYSGVPVRTWSTDSSLCKILQSVDMLRRSRFAWCPDRPAAISDAIASDRPVLFARRGSAAELFSLIPAHLRSSYRRVDSGAWFALLPNAPARPHQGR